MGHLVGAIRSRWSREGVAGHLWWSAIASLGLAALLVTTAAAVSPNVSHPNGASDGASVKATTPSSSSGSGPNGPAMPGMSGSSGSTSSGQSGGAGDGTGTTTAADGICPNVQGATVMPNGMVMAPLPSGAPTAQQQAAAGRLVAGVDQGIAKYASLAAAEAAGYRPATRANGPMTHYLNPQVVRSGDVLDPQNPSALMFANTVNGPVLLGAMFLGPTPCQPGPDVGGSLTQWHAHDNLCLSGGQVVGRTGSTGECSSGMHNASTYFMLHVWTAPTIASQYQFQTDLPPSVFQLIDRTGQA